MSRVLNRSQLSEFLGVNLSTIDNWVRDGCPYRSRPVRQGVGQWEFETGAVFQWRLDRERQSALGDLAEVDETEARRRKLAAEAGLAELELHLATGAAVKIADQERVWVQMVGAARARLIAMPSKLGPMLAIEADPVSCQALVEGAIVEALSELSGFDPHTVEPAEELSDEAVDARLFEAVKAVSRIRNIAASGGEEQLASIVVECDRARAAVFGVQVNERGPGGSQGVDSKGGGNLGAASKADGKRVGRQRKKAQPGVE